MLIKSLKLAIKLEWISGNLGFNPQLRFLHAFLHVRLFQNLGNKNGCLSRQDLRRKISLFNL